ncbi:hypothetical protein QWZ13_03280 [Reinekea marina]|uniref:hypothetical protein n=1 Tax=Reinekea marina TaxID=1310421 RepID=UPI0025B39C3C|nr:hypothetical protein [Reinekea marina]MDN3647934.1 hypothetical protein [Reinekea marina]
MNAPKQVMLINHPVLRRVFALFWCALVYLIFQIGCKLLILKACVSWHAVRYRDSMQTFAVFCNRALQCNQYIPGATR